jgi:hypothetical protein
MKSKGFSSTIHFDNNESKMSLEEKTSMDNLYTLNHEIDPSKISLTMSQSTHLNILQPTKSTTHYIQSIIGSNHQTSGLMTRATLTAINKVKNKKLKRLL